MGRKEYFYKKGDIVNNLNIIDYIRVQNKKGSLKGYKYICQKCGYSTDIIEYNLKKGQGCGVCNGKRVFKGVNDIATTHPHLIKYFVNIDDIYRYRSGSNKKVAMKCPSCNHIKNMEINKLKEYGFSCSRCSDGISYPEKFIMSFLDQLNIQYKTQWSPDWAKPRRYDFYFSILNQEYIIETDGSQHSVLGGALSYFKPLDEQKIIDYEKENLAKKHGIKLIRLDCKKSNIKYIKNSILKSELNSIPELSKVDWKRCHAHSVNSKVKEVCDLWKDGIKDIQDLSKQFKLHNDTIRKYLKQGVELGWCDYTTDMFKFKGVMIASEQRKRKIVCLNTGDIFNSINECADKSEKYFGVKLKRQGISNVCRNKNYTYRKLKFKYIDSLTNEDFLQYGIST